MTAPEKLLRGIEWYCGATATEDPLGTNECVFAVAIALPCEAFEADLAILPADEVGVGAGW